MNSIDHHHIKHHLFRLKYTELNEVFYFMAIRAFALSLFGIFTPIYLYRSGFAVSSIFGYYLAMYMAELLLEYFSGTMIKRFGPKHVIVFSIPFLTIHLWQLFSLQQFHWSPYLIGITGGISLALNWQAYHYDFSRAKHQRKVTREVGKLYIALSLLGAIAPLIGGYLSARYGVNIVLLISIFMLILGSTVLFKTKDTNFRKGRINLGNIRLSEVKNDLLAYMGMGWESSAASQIWPFFLGLIIVSYAKIGLISSLSVVLVIIVTYWVSHLSDKGKRMNFIKYGSFGNAFIGIAQIFVETVTQAFATNLFRSFTQSVQTSPFEAEYYLRADEESRSEYLLLMESATDLSKIFYFSILLGLSLYLSLKAVVVTGLIMGAMGSLLVPLIPSVSQKIDYKNAKIKIMPKPVR